jgi:hypothetical protein
MASWTKSKRNRRLWLLLFAAIGLGFIVALALTKTFSPGSEPPAGQSRVRDAVALQAATTRKVHLYFASRNGRYLQAEERRIEVKDTVSAIEAIVVALLEGLGLPMLTSLKSSPVCIPAGLPRSGSLFMPS